MKFYNNDDDFLKDEQPNEDDQPNNADSFLNFIKQHNENIDAQKPFFFLGRKKKGSFDKRKKTNKRNLFRLALSGISEHAFKDVCLKSESQFEWNDNERYISFNKNFMFIFDRTCFTACISVAPEVDFDELELDIAQTCMIVMMANSLSFVQYDAYERILMRLLDEYTPSNTIGDYMISMSPV